MGQEDFTDEQLVAQASQGDRQAVGELFNRYFDRVYDLSLGMVRNRETAADIAQTTFVKVMESLPKQAPPSSFRAWLYTIARNTALDELRRSKRVAAAPVVVTDEGDELTLEPGAPAVWSEPGQVVADEETVALVWDAAAGLSPDDHALLDLNLRKGLEPGEIATVLGIAPGAVYTKLTRLRSALEASVSALLLWRKGRRDCPDLKALVDKYEAEAMTPNLRKAINRHLGECDRCQASRKRFIAAGALFSAVPLFVAPPHARAAALAAALEQAPGSGDPPDTPRSGGSGHGAPAWVKGLIAAVAAAGLFGAGWWAASIRQAPAVSEPPPPAVQTVFVSGFRLQDPASGSDQISSTLDLAVSLQVEGQAEAWIISEDARTLPEASDPVWKAAQPDRFRLGPGDGRRTVFLWVRNEAGLATRSDASILIDTGLPSAPRNLASTSHVPGQPTTENVVVVTWAPAQDPAPGSGLAGYATEWDNPGAEDPVEITFGPEAVQAQSPPLPPGEWYFLIRAVDRAGNRGPLERFGPFVIRAERVAEPTPVAPVRRLESARPADPVEPAPSP